MTAFITLAENLVTRPKMDSNSAEISNINPNLPKIAAASS
jgi:hypothetical protein